jgi:hypothetical protein
MRFLVVGAAAIIAAAVPFASSNGESRDCAECLRIIEPPAVVSRAAVTVAPDETDVANAQAELALPDKADSRDDKAADASPSKLCNTLVEAAQSNGLPPGFLARLIWQESRFDPTSVSRVGARGIAQFMPETAAEVGLSNPYDPIESVAASARLLSRLNREFGNLGLAAGAYNAGSGRVRDWLANRQSLPKETRAYIRIITGHTAENWTEPRSVIDLQTKQPADSPCREAVAEHSSDATPVTVALTPEIKSLIDQARKEAAAAEQRRKLAKASRHRRGKSTMVASRRGKKVVVAGRSRNQHYASAK